MNKEVNLFVAITLLRKKNVFQNVMGAYAVELQNVGNFNFKLHLFQKTLIALFPLFKLHKNKFNKTKKAIRLTNLA